MSTILITGASRGLGLEFVRQYAEAGETVIAACRNPSDADALNKFAVTHANISLEALDVGDPPSIQALAKKLNGTAIDLLINNAGIYSSGGEKSQSFGALDFKGWAKVLHTNSIAPLEMLEAFLPHLTAGTGRKLANVTSQMGSIALMGHGSTAYRSSKAALNAAMRSIAGDLEAKQIAWVNLHPGWVKTDMGGKNADITPEVSIAGMRKVIGELSAKNSGEFRGYDGETIPW